MKRRARRYRWVPEPVNLIAGFFTFLFFAALVVLGIFFLLVAQTCEAQDADPMLHPDTRAPGVWLSSDLARDALECVETRDLADERYRLLTERLELRDGELRLLRVAEERAHHALAGLERVVADARAEAEAARAWYRSPVLWGLVGLVLGFGGAIALALGT